MIKHMTLARRADGVSADGFADRWRDQALASLAGRPSGARPQRLVHCVVRQRRTEPSHHAVALSWYDDGVVVAPPAGIFGDDGLLDPASVEDIVLTERCVQGEAWLDEREHSVDGDRYLLLIAFIRSAPTLTRTEFRDYWWDQHRPLANELVPQDVLSTAYRHNYVVPGDPAPWDGIGEFYEATLDTARARTAWTNDDPAASLLLEDERKFLEQDTRQVLVTDCETIIAG